MFKQHRISSRPKVSRNGGFTLIELMIVVAIIAIILTLALPVYSNYSVRARVAEAISVGAAAKTATAATCVEDPTIPALTNRVAGYGFIAAPFVETIDITGPCTAPVISITTRNTGAVPEQILTLTGLLVGNGQITWSCTASGPSVYVPRTCRS